jgi:hypothetical protein
MKKSLIALGVLAVIILGALIFSHYGKYHYYSTDTTRSSFITEAEYNSYFEHLILGLNGKRYDYCGVLSNTWASFIESDSLGSYYNSSIKGKYSCGGERADADPICLSTMIAVSNTWTADIEYAKTHSDDKLETKQTDFYNECVANRL